MLLVIEISVMPSTVVSVPFVLAATPPALLIATVVNSAILVSFALNDDAEVPPELVNFVAVVIVASVVAAFGGDSVLLTIVGEWLVPIVMVDVDVVGTGDVDCIDWLVEDVNMVGVDTVVDVDIDDCAVTVVDENIVVALSSTLLISSVVLWTDNDEELSVVVVVVVVVVVFCVAAVVEENNVANVGSGDVDRIGTGWLVALEGVVIVIDFNDCDFIVVDAVVDNDDVTNGDVTDDDDDCDVIGVEFDVSVSIAIFVSFSDDVVNDVTPAHGAVVDGVE